MGPVTPSPVPYISYPSRKESTLTNGECEKRGRRMRGGGGGGEMEAERRGKREV